MIASIWGYKIESQCKPKYGKGADLLPYEGTPIPEKLGAMKFIGEMGLKGEECESLVPPTATYISSMFVFEILLQGKQAWVNIFGWKVLLQQETQKPVCGLLG